MKRPWIVFAAAIVATGAVVAALSVNDVSSSQTAPKATLFSSCAPEGDRAILRVPTPSAHPLRIGFAVAGSDSSTASLNSLDELAGERPSLVMTYLDFHQPPPLVMMQQLASRGQTMMITWEPWQWGSGLSQPTFQTRRLADGTFDSYVISWARTLAKWGKPVLLRFGQEMNMAIYPWGDTANGNHSGDYIRAWRHIHDLFEDAGASNVSWVWSPNIPETTSQPLEQVFPGKHYVDYVALDGYNWGSTQSWSHWVEPCKLFAAGLNDLRALAPGKPILIGETGAAEQGGDKAEWTRQLIGFLNSQPDVVGVIMFNQNKETDWRVNSSPAALTAFQEALRDRSRRG